MANKPEFSFALEYVSDIDAAKRFYTELLGFEVERAAPEFVQFKQHFAIATDEPMDDSTDVELYWTVDDFDAAFSALPRNADISLAPTEKPFGKVFGVRDPDGNVRYILQFSTKRRSKPERAPFTGKTAEEVQSSP